MNRLILLLAGIALALSGSVRIFADGFIISRDGRSASVVVSDADWQGVRRAAADLADDIGKVSGIASALVTQPAESTALPSGRHIIVGTIGRSPVIDSLIADAVSYEHLRAHEPPEHHVCPLLL